MPHVAFCSMQKGTKPRLQCESGSLPHQHPDVTLQACTATPTHWCTQPHAKSSVTPLSYHHMAPSGCATPPPHHQSIKPPTHTQGHASVRHRAVQHHTQDMPATACSPGGGTAAVRCWAPAKASLPGCRVASPQYACRPTRTAASPQLVGSNTPFPL